MEAKTGEADDSLSLNHLVWHQLLDQKTSKPFSLRSESFFGVYVACGKTLTLWSLLFLFTITTKKTQIQRAPRDIMIELIAV